MDITVKNITDQLENFAPIEYSEPYDNVGLIIGSYEQIVRKLLITLDITEEIIEEAIKKTCNLIISFHPILFKPINKLTGLISQERIIILSLKNNISIYVIHTNLDVIWNGINSYISNILDLYNTKVLFPKKGIIKKLTTYVPISYAERVRNSLFSAGAGEFNNYSCCSYNFDGIGTFLGNEDANPTIGKKQHFNIEKETCINVIFPYHKIHSIKNALFTSHPYEEVAYEIYNLENYNSRLGIGISGFLKKEMNEYDFLRFLKTKMSLSYIRHSFFTGKELKKIAIISGSGSFGIEHAIKGKYQVFVSSDLKYHDFLKSTNKIFLIDINHYESEKFNKIIIKSFLQQRFSSIDIAESSICTNPIQYFY
ncbi:Nif3-like dinuclear metal center hexameric protein [Blattabacterium cuenoti]|uniref:Nif3-like dinuclear metal center hexameric protein n=1 Tax=Blattabacterium cuenoti TaxID=1653831 RepID=UPI00163CE584|nr:Nif3-like dinuclear metal center hexameric protein [Blattabacterium cuenoti]